MIETKDVKHMAQLARLEIDDATQERFVRQFGDILGHMDMLQAVDTEGIEALYSPLDTRGVYRADCASPAEERVSRERLMSNAPASDGQFFIVPRIV